MAYHHNSQGFIGLPRQQEGTIIRLSSMGDGSEVRNRITFQQLELDYIHYLANLPNEELSQHNVPVTCDDIQQLMGVSSMKD